MQNLELIAWQNGRVGSKHPAVIFFWLFIQDYGSFCQRELSSVIWYKTNIQFGERPRYADRQIGRWAKQDQISLLRKWDDLEWQKQMSGGLIVPITRGECENMVREVIRERMARLGY